MKTKLGVFAAIVACNKETLSVPQIGKHYTSTTSYQNRYIGGWKTSGPPLAKFGKKEQARAAKRVAK